MSRPLHLPSPASRPTPELWASPLFHPLPLVAVLLLAINDHCLKGARLLPMAITGKLSDVAGLFFFPLLLVSLLRGTLALWRRPFPACGGWLGLSALAMTAASFIAAKAVEPANAWLTLHWGVIEPDLSDLYTLVVLPLSWLWLRCCDSRRTSE